MKVKVMGQMTAVTTALSIICWSCNVGVANPCYMNHRSISGFPLIYRGPICKGNSDPVRGYAYGGGRFHLPFAL